MPVICRHLKIYNLRISTSRMALPELRRRWIDSPGELRRGSRSAPPGVNLQALSEPALRWSYTRPPPEPVEISPSELNLPMKM